MLRTDAAKARLIGHAQPNLALTPQRTTRWNVLHDLSNAQGIWGERLIEFAGRLCYHSTPRMGTAPDFIRARVREKHEDIVEHMWATVEFSKTYEPARFRSYNRHCEVSHIADGVWLVSANFRVWLDWFRAGIARDAFPLLYPLAPSVFAEIEVLDAPVLYDPHVANLDWAALAPVEDNGMKVALLSFANPLLRDKSLLHQHGQATFLFDGISRACTHQLVRHRLASFSQESQRYVDLEKGKWTAVIPDALRTHPEARQIVDEFWAQAETQYARLRALGIRKEDARFLLPNAAETRIVVSMNYEAWLHFFWMRAVDKAAQWEIRRMAQHALRLLHTVSPSVFAEPYQAWRSSPDAARVSLPHDTL